MTLAHRPASVLFLFGPTAVGKTAFLKTLPGARFEVISADSLQVYRGLDIGTAKPSQALQERLRHHLINIRDCQEQFQVGDFVRLANRAVADIAGRGSLPVVSGGAAFYIRHLLFGLSDAPQSTPAVRSAVRARLAERGLPNLYEELKWVDPATAERVGPADEYRITRALEVYEVSGRPLSDFPPPEHSRGDINAMLVGLERSREELYRRINERVARMFELGLRMEVERLVDHGCGSDAPAMRGIGYREFFSESGALRPRSDDLAICAEIQQNSRRYAKRQLTFFRSLPDVHWHPADDVAGLAAIVEQFA